MNCTVIQRRLLSVEEPEQPASDIRSHLAECPTCRAWHRRLVQMEQHIPLLPVPPSTAKALLLQRLRDAHPARRVEGGGWRVEGTNPSSPSTLHPPPSTRQAAAGSKERGLRKLSVAFALAASLLVFALAWWSWPHQAVSPPDVAQREQARLDARLTTSLRGKTPQGRVLRLAALAEQIHGEARRMVDDRQRLDRWARFYTRVVGQHLMEQARQLPADERLAVMEKVAAQLRTTESDASRYAVQLQLRAPHSAESFQRIAFAARKGEQDLRALMKS